ncbi:MAG: type I-A CRISPR-associated protein Cas4/Csa1 [Candidatus Nezhaarchaeales archaeon]
MPRWVWDYVRATSGDGGYAEVRGWKYEVVGPRYNARPFMTDVCSPCPTRRDVFLRRVLGVNVDSELLALGRAVHEAFLYPFKLRGRGLEAIVYEFKKLLKNLKGVERYRSFLYEVFKKGLTLAAISEEEQIPLSIEPRVPGAVIGLSDYVRPDILLGFIPVDVVLSSNGDGLGRKEVALAGYSLAVEAWTGHPVDVGIVISIPLSKAVRVVWRVVRIDDPLRRRFIELRDDVARMLEYNEEPERPSSCNQGCPYRSVCWGEGDLHLKPLWQASSS